jgi:hypothetical protein
MRIELPRFELEADRNHLVPANLVPEPDIHLEPMGPTAPAVRLLGPGLILILRGAELDEFDAEWNNAGGGQGPDFPALRFEPPHFLIGDKPFGIACDEIIIDYSTAADPPAVTARVPPAVPGTFRGLLLEELGVFWGDRGPGTWSGMASLNDFIINFDPVELTGTFVGELVHHVVEPNPQVVIRVFAPGPDGRRVEVPGTADVVLEAPSGNATVRRVRLVAVPNWDSAGFRVAWTVPEGVLVEEPTRTHEADLGWVQLPPGDHNFRVEVTDHRVKPLGSTIPPGEPDPIRQSRLIRIAERTVAAGTEPPALVLRLEATIEDPSFGTDPPTNRVHLNLRAGQTVTIRARASGGTGTSASVTLTLPAGLSLTGGSVATQTATRANGRVDYQVLGWQVRVDASLPAARRTAISAMVTVGAASTAGRLRVRFEDTPADGAPDFELISYTDWRGEPGIGLARFQTFGGLPESRITWRLASQAINEADLVAAATDSFFAGGTLAGETEIQLANSAGTVRPYLAEMDRLWRLTGSVGAGTSPQAPLVLGRERDQAGSSFSLLGSRALREQPVRAALGATPQLAAYRLPGGELAESIQFPWDRATIQPANSPDGPERPPLPLTEINDRQAAGFADLFRAIDEHAGELDEVILVGQASSEGPFGHNQKLSKQRVDAVAGALSAPPPELLAKMSALPAPHTLAAVPAGASAWLAANAGAIRRVALGEFGATDPFDPDERRVFPILKLRDSSIAEIVREEYYLTLASPPPPGPSQVAVPPRRLRDHPFRHAIFRLVHVEAEFVRNDLVRFQIRLTLDFEAFDENDLPATDDLNTRDGITTLFFEWRELPAPLPGEPTNRWEASVLADPGDVDGLGVLSPPNTTLPVLGPPAVVIPPLTAMVGGRVGPSAALTGAAAGYALDRLDILDVQRLVWRGLRGRIDEGGDHVRWRLALDYTARYTLDVNLQALIGLPGVHLRTVQPIEVTFRNIGVEVGSIEFFYDPADGFAMEINDPGVYQLDEGVGRLLDVRSVRTGAGSPLWIEVELGLAFETGIFSIEALRLRISLDADRIFDSSGGTVTLNESAISLADLSVTLTKLAASLSVPGVIEGSGELGFTQSGTTTVVEGGLDLTITPIRSLHLGGKLKILSRDDFRAVFAALEADFAPGLPLGSTGVAVYGFHGLLGANMGRTPPPDPLEWLKRAPVGALAVEKWDAAAGNWAFGVGAVVGTVFDSGWSFNTKGTLIVEIPGPRLLLATQTQIIQTKPPVGGAPTSGVLSTVLLDFENDIFAVGIDFLFEKENLLEFHVPVDIFFNLRVARDWHIRFGQWDPASRRIELRILGLWRAWGYFVIEGDGWHQGGLDLEGICVATGARIEIFWGSRDIGVYLEAYLEYHVGLQLDPLYLEGLLRVGGELHVGPVGLGARGELEVKAAEPFVVRGEICGSIDLWLFSLSACADFTIGDGSAATPAPDSPFARIVAIDRMTGLEIPEGDPVPVDAVLHVLFDQDILDRRPTPAPSVVDDPLVLRNQVSDDLYYEFDLRELTLAEAGGAVVPVRVGMWAPYSLPAHLGGPGDTAAEAAASAASQRTLRLFDWLPSSHARPLDFASGYGSTIGWLIEQVCEPVPEVSRTCATFDEEALGSRPRWLLDEGELRPVRVFTSLAGGLGAEGLASDLGYARARVVPLVPVTYPDRVAVRHCLRLPVPAGREPGKLETLLEVLPPPSRDPDAAIRSAKDIIEALDGVILGGTLGDPLASAWQAGLVYIQLPGLVAVDAVLILPEEIQQDRGEIAVLDEKLGPILGPLPLDALPDVPGASGTGRFADHTVRRLRIPLDEGTAHPPACWIVIRPPAQSRKIRGLDPYAYITEVCGITQAEWLRSQEREETRKRFRATLDEYAGIFGADPAAFDELLLRPNTTYQLSGSIDWRRYRDAATVDDDGASTGPVPFSATFQTTATAPGELRRYVLGHDPVNAEEPHYFEDPVAIEFASQAIDRIFARFGRQLVARAKADTGTHVVIQPVGAGIGATFSPIGDVERSAWESLDLLPDTCINGSWPGLFPRGVHRLPEPLTPSTGYTVSLLPRPVSEPDGLGLEAWDDLLDADFRAGAAVFRFELRTSRWPNFAAHVDAYAAASIGDAVLTAAEAVILDGGGDALVRSDEAVDGLCQALFGGPVSIPGSPEVVRLWGPRAGGGLRLRAILLDGPEPLLKRGPNGTARTIIEARQAATATGPFAAAAPIPGARVVSGVRGARVFVVFPEVTGAFVVLELRDATGRPPNPVGRLVVEAGDTPGSFREED